MGVTHVVFTVAAIVLGARALPAVGFHDAGELGVAAVTLGVPHPTGFAVDMLYLRAAGFVPLGSLAYRLNLATALVGAGALAALALLAVRLGQRVGVPRGAGWVAALPGLASLSTWPTLVACTTAVEVYASALMVMLLASHAALSQRHRALVMPCLGLCLGLHVTTGVFVAALLMLVLWQTPARRRGAFLLVGAPAIAATAMVALYLPLASLREPPLDWGNPDSLGRMFHHLTAARIRQSASAAMDAGFGAVELELLGQLGDLGWPCLLSAALGLALGLRRLRAPTLVLCAALAADLAYALWVNPMGIVDHQVGHLSGACLALLSSLGLGVAGLWVAPRLRMWLWAPATLSLAAVPLVQPGPPWPTTYEADELYGGGGPLAAVPPRSVLVAWSDSQVAAGLFARFAEGARPDVAVVPAQHLWDRQYQRRLLPLALVAPAVDDFDPRKGAIAERVVAELAQPGLTRPVFWESPQPLLGTGRAGLLTLSASAPWFQIAGPGASRLASHAWCETLDALATRRLGTSRRAGEPSSASARSLGAWAWARAYRLAADQAVRSRDWSVANALAGRAVQLDPQGVSNLIAQAVALAGGGQVGQALTAAKRAVALAPENRTAWVNLVRFTLAAGDRSAARHHLDRAGALGVRDGRLDRLRQALDASP